MIDIIDERFDIIDERGLDIMEDVFVIDVLLLYRCNVEFFGN